MRLQNALFEKSRYAVSVAVLLLSFGAMAQSVSGQTPVTKSEAGVDAGAQAASDAVVVMRGPAGEVTVGQLKAALQAFVPAPQRERFFESPRSIEQLALSVYTRQALATEAKDKGFDQRADVAQAIELAKMQFIADQWLLQKGQDAEPTSEQLEKYARSVFEGQAPQKTADGKAIDFESQRDALIEQARAKLANQARAEAWNAAQAGAESIPEAIEAQVTKSAEKK